MSDVSDFEKILYERLLTFFNYAMCHIVPPSKSQSKITPKISTLKYTFKYVK